EKERLVLDDRSTKYAAKIIQPLLGFCETIVVHKPVSGVQHGIPEVLEQCAVKIIRSRSRRNRDLPTRGTSELRSKRRCLHSELLHGINRYQAVGSTRSAQRRQSA